MPSSACRSEEHTSELQSRSDLVCRLLLEKKKIVLEQFFRLIPPERCRHPFLSRPAPPLGVVIITSDGGVLGGLNSAVIQRELAARDGQPAELMVLGGRGKNYFTDIEQPFTQFPGIRGHIVSERVEALRDHIVAQFLRQKLARVLVVYPRPLSFTQQEEHAVQLLPYERPPPGSVAGPAETPQTVVE